MAVQMEALTLKVPSLKDATSLTVKGPVKFPPGVTIKGDVTFVNGAVTFSAHPQKRRGQKRGKHVILCAASDADAMFTWTRYRSGLLSISPWSGADLDHCLTCRYRKAHLREGRHLREPDRGPETQQHSGTKNFQRSAARLCLIGSVHMVPVSDVLSYDLPATMRFSGPTIAIRHLISPFQLDAYRTSA